jgi:hypothetical protein
MSSIDLFYGKLHSAPISLENLKEIHAVYLHEWLQIRPDQPTQKSQEIDDMFTKIEHNFLSHQPLADGQIISESSNAEYRVISRWLTPQQFKDLPKGFGARVGILPYYNDSTGTRYVLNLSNRGLYSDFGGGVKAKKTPYYGLVKELAEECPQWTSYFLEQIDHNHEVRIHCVETLHKYDEEINKKTLRFSVMLLVPFERRMIREFRPTKEVKTVMCVGDLHEFISQNPVNSGLQHVFNQNLV